MKIIYLNHSGFLIELKEIILIIDYYTDPKNILGDYHQSQKPIVFIATHSHPDHFNPKIFEYKSKGKIHYLLDKTCRNSVRIFQNKGFEIEFLEDEEVPEYLKESIINLHLFPSTDEGSAIFLEAKEGLIFHAGDLNNWDWQDEDTPQMEKDFQRYLSMIEKKLDGYALDACFFPVDERLGDLGLKGPLQFLNKVDCKHFFCMHNNGKNIIQEKLRNEINNNKIILHPSIMSGETAEI